jgi:hypothetical protein
VIPSARLDVSDALNMRRHLWEHLPRQFHGFFLAVRRGARSFGITFPDGIFPILAFFDVNLFFV